MLNPEASEFHTVREREENASLQVAEGTSYYLEGEPTCSDEANTPTILTRPDPADESPTLTNSERSSGNKDEIPEILTEDVPGRSNRRDQRPPVSLKDYVGWNAYCKSQDAVSGSQGSYNSQVLSMIQQQIMVQHTQNELLLKLINLADV